MDRRSVESWFWEGRFKAQLLLDEVAILACLQLLDWTARQVRADKHGAMPEELEPLFERLQISAELWVECVENFHKWFRSSLGRPKSMATHAEVQGLNRAISIKSSRRVFVSLSVVSCQLSVVSCQLSVVSCQLSVVSCQLSVPNHDADGFAFEGCV